MKSDELKDYDYDPYFPFQSRGRFYDADEVDEAIAELKENHKKEVEQLLMKIANLEKLVETADKLLKQKGGFTVKDVKFGGVKLEGTNTHKKEA